MQAIDQYVEPLAGRRIDPVRVLDDDDDGLARRQYLDLLAGRRLTWVSQNDASADGAKPVPERRL